MRFEDLLWANFLIDCMDVLAILCLCNRLILEFLVRFHRKEAARSLDFNSLSYCCTLAFCSTLPWLEVTMDGLLFLSSEIQLTGTGCSRALFWGLFAVSCRWGKIVTLARPNASYPHLACPPKNANRRHSAHTPAPKGKGRHTLEGLGIKVTTSKITEPSLCTRLCVDLLI